MAHIDYLDGGETKVGAEPSLTFRGGPVVTFVPLLVMVCGVMYLSLQHASLRALWVAFAGALGSGVLLAKHPDEYAQAAVRGLTGPLFGIMSLAIIFAAIIGAILQTGGMIEALADFAVQAKITGNTYVALVFLIASTVGVSTGSAGATILTAGPILYPIGYLAGADPAFLVGAIVSGGAFGDNMAPVGNTSIASAVTQGAQIGEVVRARLKYAIPCALITTVLFYLLPPVHPVLSNAGEAAATSASSNALLLLLAPVIVVVLAIRRKHLLIALFWGIIVGLGVGLAAGLITFTDIMSTPAEFESGGIILDGIDNALDIVVCGVFLFPLVNVLVEGGITALTLRFMRRVVSGVRSAEASIVGMIISLGVVTATDTLSIIVAGPVVREIGAEYGIARNRRANLMDCASVTISFMLPYSVAALLGTLLSQRFAPVEDPFVVTPLSAGLHMIYCWVMLGVLAIAILTGFGRTLRSDDNADTNLTEEE